MKPKYIIILILVALAAIFVFQNGEVVTIQFFLWTIAMSRIIMIGGLLLIGFLIGFLLARK